MNLELPPAPHGDVVTLHDVVAWKFRDETTPVKAATAELRRADAVICVSEFSANEAVDLLGIADPVVVPNGVDQRFFDAQPLDPPTRDRWGIPDHYVLHAGGATHRKNLLALAEAWPAVHRERPQLRLVLSGPPHPRRTELFSHLPGAHLAGRLPDTVMPGLVAGARAVVVPSLYEGFGLPALEAMAAGVPLVAADTSALTEVAAGAGILVAPTGGALADGLISALRRGGDVDALVAAGRLRARDYTWERSAASHARVWRDVAGR